MAQRLIQRHDTAANWSAYNPVLAMGELGLVTDQKNRYKIGDGVTPWNSLPYQGFNGNIVNTTGSDENAVMSQAAVTRELTELESKVGLEVYFAAGNVPTFSANNDSLDIVLPNTELRIYDKSSTLKYTIDTYKGIKFSIPAASQLVYFVQTKELSVIPLSGNGNYIKLLSVKNTSSSKVVDGLLSSFFTEYRFKDSDNVENLKQSTTIYTPAADRESIYLEEHINSGNVYFKASSLNVRCNSATKNYTMRAIASELGTSLVTSIKGVADCIAIPNISALAYNVSTKSFEILSRDLIGKEHIILLEGSSGQIIYIHQNLLNTNDIKEVSEDLKSGYEAYFAANAKPTFTNSGDSIKITFPGEELRIYDSKGGAVTINSYSSSQFTLSNFQRLVLNLRTKTIQTISFSEVVNFSYLTLFSLTGGTVSGLLSKYYQYSEIARVNNVETLKNKVQLYVDADNRDSVVFEENTSTGQVFFTYSGSLVIRSSVKNRNLSVADLANELGVSLVVSTKGVNNCIAIPNINNLCFNALTGAFEIVHRDSVTQEHVILIAGASGVVIHVYQNLLNAFDVRSGIKELSGFGFTSSLGQLPNINTSTKTLDLGEDPVLFLGTNYYPFKELFPNNPEYYRAIPFYAEGVSSGAVKLILNIATKRVYVKPVANPINTDEVVIGGLRLVYGTHDFVSANLPFNYTVDGKTLEQFEISKKRVCYIGERPNLPMRSEFSDLFSISTSSFVLNTQGMDVYANKYLFQGSNEPSESTNYNNIVVVDMDSKNIIGGFEYKKESHLNTINCGQKYAESDTYPLLYVSECYYEHKCEVVRLANDLTSYQVIQRIAYSGSHFAGWSAYDWTIDLENSFIYAFGTNNGFTQILKFALPSPTSGDVVLTDSDILEAIEFNGAYIYQGARVINNQMYIPFGFDTSEYPAYLKVVDLERKMVVSHIPLDGIGEPEAVALYKNNLLVVNHANVPTYTEIIL